MAVVHIPSPMRELTGGESRVTVAGTTVGEIVSALEARFPGIRDRLLEDDRLQPGLNVFVDGETQRSGLRAKVTEASEVFFIQALGGGQ